MLFSCQQRGRRPVSALFQVYEVVRVQPRIMSPKETLVPERRRFAVPFSDWKMRRLPIKLRRIQLEKSPSLGNSLEIEVRQNLSAQQSTRNIFFGYSSRPLPVYRRFWGLALFVSAIIRLKCICFVGLLRIDGMQRPLVVRSIRYTRSRPPVMSSPS